MARTALNDLELDDARIAEAFRGIAAAMADTAGSCSDALTCSWPSRPPAFVWATAPGCLIMADHPSTSSTGTPA